MLMRLSAISSLLLAFAISSCGWFADYELKIKEDTIESATKATVVDVEVREKGKTEKVTEGDGATLKVTLTVECGDADPKEYKDVAAKGGVAKITLTDLPGAKDNDCTAEAKADNAKSDEVEFKRGE